MSLPNHVYIISNGSPEVFPENSLTNFSNCLPSTFEIKRNENYMVSVESIGFSSKFSNILTPEENTTPSILIAHNVKLCSHEIPGSCTFSETNTQEELESCAKCLEWDFNANCLIHEYFFKNQFYTELNIKEFFKKITEENPVNFIYRDHVLSIEPKKLLEQNTYIFLHPTFVKTFKLPTKTKFTGGTELNTLQTPNRQMQNVLINHYYNKSLTFRGDEYYGYRILPPNKMLPLKGIPVEELKQKLPKIIRVQSSIISSQILDGSHSKDLVVFCTDFQNVDNYYYQEFLQPQKVRLQNTMLNQIDLSLRDEKGRKLQLITGVPTIVKLKFEKMDSNVKSFNVRLTSSGSELYPDNKKASFKVKLPNTLYFNDKWKVALTSITHPNTYNTFTGKEKDIKNTFVFLYNEKNYPDEYPVFYTFDTKIYKEYELLDLLNREIFQDRKNWQFLTADFQAQTKKVRLFPHYNCSIGMGHNLLDILGYDGPRNKLNNHTFLDLRRGEYLNFGKEVNLNALQPHLMIAYCNIVKPTIFASENLNVLRVLPTPDSKDKKGVILQEFQNKHFVELSNTEISEIEINFRSPDGELIPFAGDKEIILNLEFSNVD